MQDHLKNLKALVIASNSMNDQSIKKFSIPRGSMLEYLCIGENCFQNVKTVSLQDVNNLSTLVIRKNSFNRMKGTFTCAKCSSLEELIIEKGCFMQYSDISLYCNIFLEIRRVVGMIFSAS